MAKAIYVRFEVPKDLTDKIYQVVEVAKESGKIRKGTNEVTKLVERGEAQSRASPWSTRGRRSP